MNKSKRLRKTHFVRLMVGATLIYALAGCGAEKASSDGDAAALKFGDIKGGTGDITWAYIQEHNLEEEHGLDLERVANSTANLYGDFAANRYPISLGTPDGFAPLAASGAPIRMLSTNGIAADFLIATQKLQIPEDLEGAKIAAVTGSGSYKSFAAGLSEATGFDIEKSADVIPVQDNLSAVSQLLAGSVDAAFAWEADLSTALVEHPELEIVYSVSEAYEKEFDITKWSTSFAYRTDANLDPEVLEKFVALFTEAHEGLQSDPAATDTLAQELIDSKPGVFETALSSGRLRFAPKMVDAELSENIKRQLEIGQDYGTLPAAIPAGFYAPVG
jgi:ABC-type nitrate/sulfonate/bicarbonate transport system substrate-binding protein